MPWMPSPEQLRFWRIGKADEWTPTSVLNLRHHFCAIKTLYRALQDTPCTLENLNKRFRIRRLIQYNKWSILWIKYTLNATGIRAWLTALKTTAAIYVWPALAYAYYRSFYFLDRASWQERYDMLCSHDLTDTDILLAYDFDQPHAFTPYLVAPGTFVGTRPYGQAAGQKLLVLYAPKIKPLEYNHAYATSLVDPPHHRNVTLLFQTFSGPGDDLHEFSVAIGLPYKNQTWFTGIVLKPYYFPASTKLITAHDLDPACEQLRLGHTDGFTIWELTIDMVELALVHAIAGSIELNIAPTPLIPYSPKTPEHGLLTFGVSGHPQHSSRIAIRNVLLASYEPSLVPDLMDPIHGDPSKRYKPGLNPYAPPKQTEIEAT